MEPLINVNNRLQIIDSHTGGEPTRIVIHGGPDLGEGTIAARRELFDKQFDTFRSLVVNEPRGSDVMVGALLLPPVNPSSAAAVIFFNNVGTLGMCGHGTIGLGVTLGYLSRIGAGTHKIETPVGTIAIDYDGANGVTVDNVPSYRYAKAVAVEVPGYGKFVGDIAWGGNWFYLVYEHGEALNLQNTHRLTNLSWAIRKALAANGITGKDGGEIDHVELYGPPVNPTNHSRSFVMCPGGAYDRSPCGTGTSAKLACLHADGKLKPGDIWRQESILGSVFEGSIRVIDGIVHPRIRGSAYVTAEATLVVDPADPFGAGIR
jgi:4-hydroxyproline epimerase